MIPSNSSLSCFSLQQCFSLLPAVIRMSKMKNSLFDNLISELMNTGEGESLVDLCLSGDSRIIAAVPLRYRLIALGFVQKLSLEEVNEKLIRNGCMKLYARSIWEATLIFAFRNGLSYKEWKELGTECALLRTKIKEGQGVLSSPSVSRETLISYINSNSTLEDETAQTQHMTRMLSRKIAEIKNDRDAFREFLLSNISSFSTVREKTRYYFCKYLIYYLNARMDLYFDELGKGRDRKKALEFLSVFKVRTALDRKKYPEEEARRMINSSGLSLEGIYDAFRDYYFECISLDWLQIRAEYTGDIAELTGEEKKRFAEAVRRYDRKYKALSDDEAIDRVLADMEATEAEKDKQYSLENRSAAYQIGRSGGNFVRKVLRGYLDLDRVSFISFLLFLGKEGGTSIPASQEINGERLNEILQECGFPKLDPKNGCDSFFIEFMESGDPMYLLFDTAEKMALSEENFYLYKTYLKSESSDRKWEQITS